MENKLFLHGAVFCIICATILSSATDSRTYTLEKVSVNRTGKKSPNLLIASVIGHTDPNSEDWHEEDKELHITEGTDSIGRKKRSVVSLVKSSFRLIKALNFLRKDGIPVSKLRTRHLAWVKPGGAKKAKSDYFEVKPDDVTFTTTKGVKTTTGSLEGGKLVMKEDLDTHACEIVFMKILGDGKLFSCTFKYSN